MTNSYTELLHIKTEYEKRYEILMCDYYKLENDILDKEIAILKKKHKECEDELFALEQEFIFS